MKSLSEGPVKILEAALKGKKLEKFTASVAMINESLEAGGWIPGYSRKAPTGFNQLHNINIDTHRMGIESDKVRERVFQLYMCICHGSSFEGDVKKPLDLIRKATDRYKHRTVKLPYDDETVAAWAKVCTEAREAISYLTSLRPLPVVTAIGLSPKVTKTLTEMNLDIDLPSIKPTKIEARREQAFDIKGKPLFKKNGEPLLTTNYYVIWTKGVKFNRSRFIEGCQACGKSIPSGRFVPIEAKDKKSGDLIGLWIGCDCARNIFGVKDVGIEKGKKG